LSQLVVVAGEAELARALAEHVAEAAREAIAARGRFDLALAGGSTPKAAYELLAAAPLRDTVDWAKVRFFFGDERCVPPDDPQSNYKMARDALLAPLGIGAEPVEAEPVEAELVEAELVEAGRVFRMRGEDDPPGAARAYAAELVQRLGDPPAFDLLLLGMGPDGHTASLFPGSDPFAGDAALVRAPYVAKFAACRLTLTPRAIAAARKVAVAAAGAAKAEALRDALEGPYDPQRRPIQVVRRTDGTLTWLVDRAAAALLGAPASRTV
jgi:6-phosphogluconolactonase